MALHIDKTLSFLQQLIFVVMILTSQIASLYLPQLLPVLFPWLTYDPFIGAHRFLLIYSVALLGGVTLGILLGIRYLLMIGFCIAGATLLSWGLLGAIATVVFFLAGGSVDALHMFLNWQEVRIAILEETIPSALWGVIGGFIGGSFNRLCSWRLEIPRLPIKFLLHMGLVNMFVLIVFSVLSGAFRDSVAFAGGSTTMAGIATGLVIAARPLLITGISQACLGLAVVGWMASTARGEAGLGVIMVALSVPFGIVISVLGALYGTHLNSRFWSTRCGTQQKQQEGENIAKLHMLLLLVFGTILIKVAPANAWDIDTHRLLSNTAAGKSALGTSSYLKDFGFVKGLDSFIHGKTITLWIEEGAEYEDWSGKYGEGYLTGTARAFNHFHNPLKSWDQAGLNDVLYIPTSLFPPTFTTMPVSGQSSVLWQQGGAVSKNPDFGWTHVRDYFFNALTAQNDQDREKWWAYTFQGQGHLIHLVQDAAQPAHARNDAHPFDTLGIRSSFEWWAAKTRTGVATVAARGAEGVLPDWDWKTPMSNSNMVPIARLLDVDLYDGSSVASTIQPGVGLVEYTNANFVSEDTIFTENYSPSHRYYFPHPRKDETILVDEPIGATGKTRRYYMKDQEGFRIHFAVPGRWQDLVFGALYGLDENCYADYATFLIPRAVGYSAGLINYFFRGEVEISEIEEQKDANQAITGLKFKAKNLTPDEEMKDGEIWIAYRYKVQGSTEWTYGLSQLVASGSLPYQSETTYTVNFPTSIPSDATDLQYTYVFKGTLGAEAGAVVGKVIKQDVDLVILIWDDEANDYRVQGYRIQRNLKEQTFSLVPALPKVVWGPFNGVGVAADGIFYLPTYSSFEGLSVWNGKAFGVRGSVLRQQDLQSGVIVDTDFPLPEGYGRWPHPPRRCTLDGQTMNLGLFSKSSYTETGEIKWAKNPPTFSSPFLSYGAGELFLVDNVTESSSSTKQGSTTYATYPSGTVMLEGFLNDTRSFTWSAWVNRPTKRCGGGDLYGPWNKGWADNGSSRRLSRGVRTEYTIIEGSEVLLVVDQETAMGSEHQETTTQFDSDCLNEQFGRTGNYTANGTRKAENVERTESTSQVLLNGRSLLSYAGYRERKRKEVNLLEISDYQTFHAGERISSGSEVSARYTVLDAALAENQYLILYAFEELSQENKNSTTLETVTETVDGFTTNRYITTSTASGSRDQKKQWGLLSPHFNRILAFANYQEISGGEVIDKHWQWDPPRFLEEISRNGFWTPVGPTGSRIPDEAAVVQFNRDQTMGVILFAEQNINGGPMTYNLWLVDMTTGAILQGTPPPEVMYNGWSLNVEAIILK